MSEPILLALRGVPMKRELHRGFVRPDAGGDALLGPGEWTVSAAPGVIETLLGSCVCITLWHPLQRIGAACHFVLPAPIDGRGAGDPRFATEALALMLRELRTRGVEPQQCEAKLFGGGRMFEVAGPDIGQRNIVKARELLDMLSLPVTAEDLGRDGYRRIRFDLATGSVWQRFDLAQPIDRVQGALSRG